MKYYCNFWTLDSVVLFSLVFCKVAVYNDYLKFMDWWSCWCMIRVNQAFSSLNTKNPETITSQTVPKALSERRTSAVCFLHLVELFIRMIISVQAFKSEWVTLCFEESFFTQPRSQGPLSTLGTRLDFTQRRFLFFTIVIITPTNPCYLNFQRNFV